LVSRRDQGTALLVFLVLGLIEETAVSHTGLLNERIVAVCAAGLVAGPGVGLAVGVFVTWLAVVHHGLPLGSIAIPMLCGGLAGGSLYRSYPKLAQRPPTGFCLTFGVSLVRTGLIFWLAPQSPAALQRIEEIGMAPLLQGLGTALIWLLSSRYVTATCKYEQRLRPRSALCKRRQHLIERSFADAANCHGLKRARWRGLWKQAIQDLLIATVQNLRKLLRLLFKTNPQLALRLTQLLRRLSTLLLARSPALMLI
jgi:hypothetical protein